MGTRSVIGVYHGGNAKVVYCHWDGYLDHNGRILLDHYDSSKANHLVALGDLSSLGTTIGSKHTFSPFVTEDEEFKALTEEEQNRIKAETEAAYEAAKEAGWCTFYNRDRGETGCDFKTLTSWDDFLEFYDNCGAEYAYLMKDGVWYVKQGTDDLEFLADALATEDIQQNLVAQK
jgi:hypothetical protein